MSFRILCDNLLCLYLIGKFYIQTSELDMHTQTLDFRPFFTLAVKPDFQEYFIAVDSKI